MYEAHTSEEKLQTENDGLCDGELDPVNKAEGPGPTEGCPRETTQSRACRRRGKHAGEERKRGPEERGAGCREEEEDAGREEREDAVKQEEKATGEQEVDVAREQSENVTGEQEEGTAQEGEDRAAGEEETENRGGRERINEAVEEGAGGDGRRTSQTEEQRGSKNQDPEARHVPRGTWLSQGSVAFHDVAICFSQMEWTLLEDWQKERYKNVIREIHDMLISMGYAIDNPGILFRIKNDEKHNLGEYQDFDRDKRRENPIRRQWKPCHPDILLRLKEEEEPEEPYLRPQQDSEEEMHSPHPSAGGYLPSNPETLFKIKDVDISYFLDHSESCKGGGDSPPTSDSINTVTIKQEEEEPYFMDHQDMERGEYTKVRNLAEGRSGAEGGELSESPSGQEWLPLDFPALGLKHKGFARHASVSEMEIDILEASRNEISTKRHTKWAVSIFEGWLAEKHLDMCFKTISKPSLNKMLREFFATVKNSSGKQYSISSYAGLRAGMNRFFNNTRSINIVKDSAFITANNVFIGVMKSLRKQGKNVSKHNPRISDMDLQILKSSPVLSINTARGLVAKVWFDLQFYFARRGQEGHRDLMPQSFRISKDEQGIEYVTLDFNDKNRQHVSQLKTNKGNVHGCMYALPGNPLCPVNSLKKYLTKLPENPPAFYLHPIKVHPELLESQPIWYTKEPLGINYLRRMMPAISQEAGLSLCYTNHSVWSTVVHLLSNSGLQARHIKPDTGQKRKVSVDHYWAETIEDRKHLSFLVPVAAPSLSSVDHSFLPIPSGLGNPVKVESTPPNSCK